MLTERLVAHVVGTQAIPDEAMARSRNALIDTVGVALVGRSDEAVELATRWAVGQGSDPAATIWGSPARASAGDAALVNGVAAHVLDWDDTSPSLRGHPSATLIPTVLAVGERQRSSGRDMLTAYAIGVDVLGKVARALGNGHYTRGWHNSATVGVFGCAAAAGRLMGLDGLQMANALGIAASNSAGLIRNFGTMTKSLHAGQAAQAGIRSAELAALGYTADTQIFDGADSFQSTYAGPDGVPLDDLLRELGETWEVVEPGINHKKWPCCYQVHRALIGLRDLSAEHAIDPAEISRVSIGFAPGSDAALIYDDPQTGLEAKFSAQFNVAAYLLDRDLTMATYEHAAVHRPDIRALMSRVERYTVPDPKSYSGTVGYTDVRLVTSRGTFERRVQSGPETRFAWVVTDDEHDAKFLGCASFVMDPKRANELVRLMRRVTELEDVSEIGRALAAPAGDSPLA